MAQVFISYAREDMERVLPLYAFLRLMGYQPWIDIIDIVPGQRWELAVEQALKESDFILIALSSLSARKRGFLQKEIQIALDLAQRMLGEDVYLIPVRLDECIVPYEMKKYQYVDAFDADGLIRIVETIEYGKKQRSTSSKGEIAALNLLTWIYESGENLTLADGGLKFGYQGSSLQCLFDINADRMRIFTPVGGGQTSHQAYYQRMLEANFKDTRDARYAREKGVLYTAFLHPLRNLSKKQLSRGLEGVYHLRREFGTTFGCPAPKLEASVDPSAASGAVLVEWAKAHYSDLQVEDSRFKIILNGVPVVCSFDELSDTVEVAARIDSTESMDDNTYGAMLDANFQSMMEARYALRGDTAYAIFHHSLAEMTEELFRSVVSQTVEAVDSFGDSYSSKPWIFLGLKK